MRGSATCAGEEFPMDVFFVALMVVFFLLTLGLIRLCDKV